MEQNKTESDSPKDDGTAEDVSNDVATGESPIEDTKINGTEDKVDEESPDVDDEAQDEEETGPHEWDEMDAAERLEKAKTLKKEGNDEFSDGNYKESIKIYTRGLRFCPDSDPVFRSILFANRSAAKMKLDKIQEAIEDCTQAIEHNPTYVRALLRRAKLQEQLEKFEDALADYNKVLELDPSNREACLASQKLPGEINERNEKLKTEMLGKLKELGNMVLRPFGLSTDNFQLQQDPNSGGYSVNFNKS